MTIVARTGVLLPLVATFACLVGVLHAFGPIRGAYTWFMPVEIFRDVLRAPHAVVVMTLAFGCGYLARPGEAEKLIARLRSTESVPLDRAKILRTAFAGVAVLVVDALLCPAHDVLDRVALVSVLAIGMNMVPTRRALAGTLALGAGEALVSVAVLTLVSYVFTITKAYLFYFATPADARLIAVESALFGEPLHRWAAELGRTHPLLIRVADDVYFRIFEHMTVVSLFLAGLGSAVTRHRYLASLALCYLVGGFTYYVLPSLGPVYAEPALYAHLRAMPLLTAQVQNFLAANTVAVRSGTLRELPTYGFIAAMPSLHLAHETVMFAYARASRVFLVLSAVFYAATCLAVLVLGFHYALDMVFGAALGLLSVYGVARVKVQWFPGFCQPVAEINRP